MIVLDCAAVVDALLLAPGSDRLRERMCAEPLAAPTLLDYEFVSALRGLTRAGGISEPRALDALADFEALAIDRWHFDDALRHRAFTLRERVNAYDAAYVALAEALDCLLVTRDRRLAAAGGHDAQIIVL